jgi:hypothetical protein
VRVNAPAAGAFFSQIHYGSSINTGEIMLKKLLVTLVAAAFAAGAYAQAPKSDAAKQPTPAVQAQKKADSKAGTKTAKKGKAKAKSTKGKAKAKADEKKDSGKTSK